MSTESHVRKKLGSSFPVMALDEAMERLRYAVKHGTEYSKSEFAGYLGHKTANSGPFLQKVASFREWGLLSGSGDALAITELGKSLALPTDEHILADGLRAAFQNSRIFSALYRELPREIALEADRIANRAVINYGISTASKERFVTSFKRSVITAGLGEDKPGGKLTIYAPQKKEVKTTSFSGADASPPISTAQTTAFGTPIVIRQLLPIPSGHVLLEVRSSEPLSPEAMMAAAGVLRELQTLTSKMSRSRITEQ